MSDTPPDVSIRPARKSLFTGAAVVWAIPLMALLVALGVAWRSYADRGPLIVVEFENGAGISAGETELRYRDVTVGKVEKVGFSPTLDRVRASIRVDKDVAPFIDSTSVFWVVEPEVTAQGITGLSTVLSGVYIEGSWDNEPGELIYLFQGANQAPLIRPGRSGLQIAFRTVANGTLTDNAPILFKGIEVGRVGKAQIAPRGNFAVVEGLIYDEHRDLVNSSTRFWETSGFSVSIGPAGAEIDFSSIATLLGGGLTFDTFVSGGERAQDGMIFEIYPDREQARSSLFNVSAVDPLELSVIFEDNISGLAVGAPVELSGLRIGQVSSLSGLVDYNQFGDSRVRLSAQLSIQPAQLGLPEEVTADAALALLQDRVANGLRARLASASLLTGGLKIELVVVEDAPPARLVATEGELPVFPTTESAVSESAASVEGVFSRINNLPIEELLNSAIDFLNAAEAFVSDEDLRETPQDVRTLLSDLSGLVNSEDVRNVPASLNATLTRVEALVAQLEEQRLADKVLEALDAAAGAATAVSTSVEGLPDLMARIEAVAAKAEALEVEELLAELTALTESADTLLKADTTRALPGQLGEAIGQINEILTGLQQGGAVDNVNRTLTSARTAADAIPEVMSKLQAALDSASQAASDVSASVEGVPALITQIEAVAAKAETLEVQELVTELTALTRSADAVIGAPEAAALPGALKGALDELNATLAELREGGAVENVNQTLASARSAADTIATSAKDIPDVIERLTRLFAQASRTIEGYDKGDEISRSAQETLRDIQKAADALAKLARTIERNPNSLLLGR